MGNPELWLDKKLPCPGLRIVLPDEAMYLPEKFTIAPEMVLPENGVILFPNQGAELTLLDQSKSRLKRRPQNINFDNFFRPS